MLSLCALARMAAAHYPFVDCDLLLTGVVLHDIGKIYELNYERGFSYSNEGQLLGHIHIAHADGGGQAARAAGFSARVCASLVEHMILSHHGQLEFGSPKLPQFPEALLLHYLDDMDSKMECMRALIENDRQVEGCFTTFNNSLERTALKKDRYLDPSAETPKERARRETGHRGSPAQAGRCSRSAPAPPRRRCGARSGAASAVRATIRFAFCRQAEAGSDACRDQTGKLMPKTARDVPPPLELFA